MSEDFILLLPVVEGYGSRFDKWHVVNGEVELLTHWGWRAYYSRDDEYSVVDRDPDKAVAALREELAESHPWPHKLRVLKEWEFNERIHFQ